jgi:ketosteroid isomerase-like protein
MEILYLIAIHLIHLTGPEKQVIELNPKQIVSMRTPRAAEHFAPGMHCLIHTADNRIVLVQETCDTVYKLIEERQ